MSDDECVVLCWNDIFGIPYSNFHCKIHFAVHCENKIRILHFQLNIESVKKNRQHNNTIWLAWDGLNVAAFHTICYECAVHDVCLNCRFHLNLNDNYCLAIFTYLMWTILLKFDKIVIKAKTVRFNGNQSKEEHSNIANKYVDCRQTKWNRALPMAFDFLLTNTFNWQC